MTVAEACLVAGINAKANAQLLVIPRMGITDTREFNASTAGAIQGADVILGLCETLFKEKAATNKAREKGTRTTETVTRGIEDYVYGGILDVNYPLMVEIGKKICKLWEKTKLCKLVSPLGTDITFQLKGRPVILGDGMATEPGESDNFPGAQVSIAPVEETINGTIVAEGSVSPGGLVSSPITCRLKNGVITSIEGGADANAWESRLRSTGDPKAFHLCHFCVGLNPRARMTGIMIEDERVVGGVTFGFGNQDPDFKGNVGVASVHTDLVLVSPTIYLDGVVMCEKNRLNPDLGLGGL
jgi:leucyl aminopeptidase (aminopeptidase T)